MKHPCEPSYEELKAIRQELFTKPSTDENMKKIHAIDIQIKRRIKETQ